MILKRLSAIGGIALLLASCESFNHYEIGYLPAGGRYPIKATLAQASISDEINDSNSVGEPPSNTDTPRTPRPKVVPTCPVYSLPELPPVPELPYDQLDMLNSAHPEKFSTVAENHITAMHMYVSKVRRILRESHEKYLKDCQDYLSAGHQNSSE